MTIEDVTKHEGFLLGIACAQNDSKLAKLISGCSETHLKVLVEVLYNSPHFAETSENSKIFKFLESNTEFTEQKIKKFLVQNRKQVQILCSTVLESLLE